MSSVTWSLPDPEAGAQWAAGLARVLPTDLFLVSLRGDLGAGKTHTVRSLLRALGESGTVRSPTYTLLETYALAGDRELLHLDLYRLADAEELEHLGLRDYLAKPVQIFVEWPDRGAGVLPQSDLDISLTMAEPTGRTALVSARSQRGLACLNAWQKQCPAP